ncbi:MAG: hypothetical protein LM575_07370 [Caldimicrobium sp.]|nr:hypothetical protein [Caldimicrobium sp.]
MTEKLSFSLKLRERLSGRNLSLNSFSKLPTNILDLLKSGKLKPLLVYQRNIYPVQILILDDHTFSLNKEGLPSLQPFEVFLLVIPQGDVRYIFQARLSKEEGQNYIVSIIDPRSEPRLSIPKPIPTFLFFIPPGYVNKLLQNEHYYLMREINFATEVDFISKNEVYIYDLVLDEKSMVDEEFKKHVQRVFLTGILKDLSRSGACVTTKGRINLAEDSLVFYLRFEVPTKERLMKFALFSLLRDISYQEDNTNLHFNFLTSLKPEAWALIEGELKATYQA